MKAVVCKAYGPPSSLVVEEVASPEPSAGEVLIAVAAAGVNFPDTLIIEGKYQFKPPPPFTPGGEIAGVVTKLGAGVTSVKVGDRVVALMPFGGYAEEAVVSPQQLVKVPDGVDLAVAAALLTAYGTTHYALKERAALRAGETLLVLGAAGGVGLAAVELGKRAGARVIAVASSDEKLEICRAAGADVLINYGRDDLRQKLREVAPSGVDVVYDAVGGPHSEIAIRSMAWNGRHLVIGFAAGEIPKIPLNLTLLKSCSIVGVFWGAWLMREPDAARALHEELLGWVADGSVRPRISQRYALEEAAKALEDIHARKVTGKAVIVTGR